MINNVMLVSGVQQSGYLYIYIYIYIHLQIISPFRLLHN